MRIHRHEIAMQALQQQQQPHELVLGDGGVDGGVDMLQSADIAADDGTLALTTDDDHEHMVLSAQDFIAFGQVVNGLGQDNDGMLTADGQLTSVNPQQVHCTVCTFCLLQTCYSNKIVYLMLCNVY